MPDNSANFRAPAGIRVQRQSAELWPTADTTMRYLSRPPMWEPAAQPAHPLMHFAGLPLTESRPAPAAVRPPEIPPGPEPARPNPASASALEVRRVVESLLRLTLEVVDRRRRPEQLKGMATQPVIDALAVLSVNRPPGHELGTASLRKIRIVAAGDRAAEICASYARGPRVFAIAGRIERRRELWVATTLLLA